MKTTTTFLCFSKLGTFMFFMFFFKVSLFGQLSNEAQRIYDSCVFNNPFNVSYASTNGVEIISTPDSASFYLQWFPNGSIPNESPLIVTLHGSKGNAFNEFKSWHSSAQSHNCGFIAIQYNKYTDVHDYLNGYFKDDTIYSYIDSALTRISYPSQKAILHGFSLGSARSYAVIYNDIISGKNYFCTTISNAGKIDLTYPLYADIDTIPTVFAGKHWNLFCGPPETIIAGDSCGGLDFTQTWLQSKGATVDIYIQKPELGHNGFQQTASDYLKDTILNKYLECYNSTNSIKEIPSIQSNFSIHPNPFSNETVLSSLQLMENVSIVIFSFSGQKLKEYENINGSTVTISTENFNPGFYFFLIYQNGKPIWNEKIVIEN